MTPVEQIKDRLNIVDVVSAYVKLDPAGKNYKGKSPFTNERTPSFFVSPDKGLYHCFSTGKGGDIFTFVQEMEGLDFKGALRVLAERAGVTLGPVNVKAVEEKDRLYEITERAARMFEAGLASSSEAKNYLYDRGVEDHVIRDFRIGYVPAGWRYLYDELKKDFTDAEIVLAGLGKRTEKGIYDTFRDRIMFPITDTAGRPIGFSGRILHPDEKSAKYVNSPDTPLFNKSDVLFGIDKAKNFIRKYNFTILVEGQFDVIMMHQAGFRNTVGVSGTALADTLVGTHGVNNLGLVKRLSNNLILAFDADAAGIKAAKRSAEIGLSLGMDVKVVSIPGVKDPADFIRAEGRAGFEKLLREAVHVIEFSVKKICESAKDEREVGRRIVSDVLPSIAVLQSEIEKSYFIKRTSEIAGIDEAVVWKELDRMRVDPDAPRALPEHDKPAPSHRRTEQIERKLFGLYYARDKDNAVRGALEKIMTAQKFETLEARYGPLEQELIFENEIGDDDRGEALAEMLRNLEEDYLSAEIEEVKVRLKKAEIEADDNEAEQLSVEYQKLVHRLADIKNSRHINKF